MTSLPATVGATRTVTASGTAPRGLEALEPPPGHPRFPHLDAVRGLAALMIVVYHCALLSAALPLSSAAPLFGRLNMGVPTFFVLSGFLLYRPFVASQHGQGPAPRARAYLAARALRIFPAYWVVLTVCIVVAPIASSIGSFAPDRWHRWWVHYGLIQVYQADDLARNLRHTWSLAIEMSFYLALPVYALFASSLGRGERRLRRELAALAVLGVASWLGRILLFPVPGPSEPSTFVDTLPGTFGWFCVGMALAVWTVVRGRPRLRARWLLVAAGVAYLAISFSGVLPNRAELPAYTRASFAAEYVLLLIPAGLLVLAGIVSAPAVRRSPLSRAMTWLGLVSYGVYLWHFPLVFVFNKYVGSAWLGPHARFVALSALTVPASLAAGTLSYLIVERPALRVKNRLQRRAMTA